MEFLSTLSLRRATLQAPPPRRPQRHFYPRSPCGERRCKHRHHAGHSGISIHALLAESDKELKQEAGIIQQFLSTLSLRRATNNHGDHIFGQKNFYPRSPCGERLTRLSMSAAPLARRFLSTLSLRRATIP